MSQVFWNVTLCHWNVGFQYLKGAQHLHFEGKPVPKKYPMQPLLHWLLLKTKVTHTQPFPTSKQLTQQHNVTTQQTWILININVRTSNIRTWFN